MDFLVLLEKLAPLALAVLPHLARAIIDGLSAAGVTHDTVARTIAKTVLHLTNSGVDPAGGGP
ncbi:MAG TPA: hypothetical protein VK132_07535 [Gemmatimonadales bacterium]|nr:hypothetical protein [Gemmatimonadales bacterium]